ncbi:uncharacterized protein LOC111316602 isoform X2 [Durio zibethinus]|uniref:Uncharacterized protein LOC111316602 isoform X2 n=1 Tax=Durio zibethinus TaxID=66656 RepID=A0A6P6BB76_DURZI|nr:uncharacterized protein LOC111316602 isoform X2 [Durio zibethinus]
MASVEEISGIKKKTSRELPSRRKKTDNKLMARRCDEIDLLTAEKSAICFHRRNSTTYAFYLFNFSSSDEEEEEEEDYRYRILHGPYGLGRSVLPSLFGPQQMPKERWGGRFAALGSNIYHIGGFDLSKKVHCFDTSNPEGGWREVAPLIRGGHSAAVAVVDNKIYVMGIYSGEDKEEPWGQVFDPALNTWSPMPELPSSTVRAHYFTHLDDEKTILVAADGRKILYGYKVKTNSWFKFDEDFKEKGKIFAMSGPRVAVNRCLYWLGDDELYGYDLDEGELYIGKFGYLDLELRGIVRHPGDNICSEYAMSDECRLLALGGGKLCIVWQHDKIVGPYTDPLIDPNVNDSTFYCVYCVKFQVSKGIRPSKEGKLERVLNISVESSKSFLVKGPFLELGYVSAMEGAVASKEEICGLQHRKKARKIESKKSNKPMLQRCSQFSSMEKSICFWTIGVEYISNFYMFNFSYGEDSKAVDDHHYQIIHGPYGFGRSLLHPIVSGYKKNRESSCIALGSTIYCLGGFHKTKSSKLVTHTRKVHCFDTRDPGGVRNKVPSMIKPRFQPHIHTLEGKIYVLGGLHKDDTSGPWLEMFDPCLNKWIGLSSDPYISTPLDSCFTSALLEDSKILLVFHDGQDYMHAYDIAMDSWYVYGDKFDRKDYPFFGEVVTIDKTLYQYDCKDGIVAYDLDKKKWFRGQFWRSHLELRGLLSQPVDSQLESEVFPILLHIGGRKLCLLWQHRNTTSGGKDNEIVSGVSGCPK